LLRRAADHARRVVVIAMGKENADTGTAPLTFFGGSAVVVAAVIYFTGWTYSYYFFGAFGVSLRQLESSSTDVMVLAFSVLFSSTRRLLGLVLLVALILGARRLLRERRFAVEVELVLVLILFWWVFASARDAAAADALAVRLGYRARPVQLTFDASAMSRLPPELLRANGEFRLLPVVQTKSGYVVLVQPEGSIPGEVAVGYVFEIPSERVAAVTRRITNVRTSEP